MIHIFFHFAFSVSFLRRVMGGTCYERRGRNNGGWYCKWDELILITVSSLPRLSILSSLLSSFSIGLRGQGEECMGERATEKKDKRIVNGSLHEASHNIVIQSFLESLRITSFGRML